MIRFNFYDYIYDINSKSLNADIELAGNTIFKKLKILKIYRNNLIFLHLLITAAFVNCDE